MLAILAKILGNKNFAGFCSNLAKLPGESGMEQNRP
jgi:hypothetical protein